MSVITGKVLAVEIDVQIKKQAGGTYPGWSIDYKSSDGEARSYAKHMNSLKYNAGLKSMLQELQPGDEFTLVSEKNAEGFLNPKTLQKGIVNVVQTPAQAPAAPAPSGTNSAPNTFQVNNELKEKQMRLDELKQPMIIRQVCLKAAAELATLLKHTTAEEVIKQADSFVRYVEFGSIEDMPNDDIEVN
jgi:hypothetical protein